MLFRSEVYIFTSISNPLLGSYLFLLLISADGSTPRLKRKRLRSLTPSEIGINGNKDTLRSPLAKRKKLAANRTGSSKLKVSISAGELSQIGSNDNIKSDIPEEDDEEVGVDEGIDEGYAAFDDDFLAGALEEEWG